MKLRNLTAFCLALVLVLSLLAGCAKEPAATEPAATVPASTRRTPRPPQLPRRRPLSPRPRLSPPPRPSPPPPRRSTTASTTSATT